MSVDIPTPSAIPYLLYEDPARIRDFLTKALGFTEVATNQSPEGEIGNIQLRMADKYVMLSRPRTRMGMTSPGALPAVHAGVMVYVDGCRRTLRASHIGRRNDLVRTAGHALRPTRVRSTGPGERILVLRGAVPMKVRV